MCADHRKPPCELILFTRYPEPGKVKTRFIPFLGRSGAARLHRQLAEHVFSSVQPVACNYPCRLSVHYAGGTELKMRRWLGDGVSLTQQAGPDLGRRMAMSLCTARDHGSGRTVLIGSDCPSINESIVAGAFDLLEENDLVLGPTFDGGYYLIGMKEDLADSRIHLIFENIAWGTSAVYAQTLDQAGKAGLSLNTVEKLHDIDRPEDLEHFNYNPDPE